MSQINNASMELNNYINDLLDAQQDISQEKLQRIADEYNKLTDKVYFEILFQYSFIRRFILTGEKCFELEGPIVTELRKSKSDFFSLFERYIDNYAQNAEIRSNFKRDAQGIENVQPFVFFFNDNLPIGECEIQFPLITNTYKNFIDSFERDHPKTSLKLSELSIVDLDLKITNNNSTKSYKIITQMTFAAVLLALSEKSLKFSEIVKILNSNRIYAIKTIKYLHDASLIKRKGQGNKLTDNDEFTINNKFSSPSQTIVVFPVPQLRARMNSKIDIIKSEAIMACIIRKLKYDSNMKLPILYSYVVETLGDNFEITEQLFNEQLTHACSQNFVKVDDDTAYYIP